MLNKDELQELAKAADAAATEIERIAQELADHKGELEERRDLAKERAEALIEKRDDAQTKFDALSETAQDGKRGQSLNEKIEKLQNELDEELEPGVTVESVVEDFETEISDALNFLDEFEVEDLRRFADAVDHYADNANLSLTEVEVEA